MAARATYEERNTIISPGCLGEKIKIINFSPGCLGKNIKIINGQGSNNYGFLEQTMIINFLNVLTNLTLSFVSDTHCP